MDNFVAIDVETANKEPSSICAIGVVKVSSGRIVDRYYELVKPEPEYFIKYFTSIHGITRQDVDDSRCFAHVWRDIDRFIGSLPLVAHNKMFDERCIRAAHKVYGMEYPAYKFLCTLTMARKTIPHTLLSSYSLPYLCEFLGIPFNNHHNALADAEACAKIAVTLL